MSTIPIQSKCGEVRKTSQMHLVNRGALAWLVTLWRCLYSRHEMMMCAAEYSVGVSWPTCYLSERCSVSQWLRSIIRNYWSISSHRCHVAVGTEHNIVPLQMTVTVRQANAEKRAFSFLKPLSILFSLSCSTAPQYSLKSFRGTSEAFVECICVQCVISWKMPSLLFSFCYLSQRETYIYIHVQAFWHM